MMVIQHCRAALMAGCRDVVMVEMRCCSDGSAAGLWQCRTGCDAVLQPCSDGGDAGMQ